MEQLFEAGSPLACRLAGLGPFSSGAEMIAAARREIGEMSEADKIATLNAHPRIGGDATLMSQRSRREQGTEAVPELEALNDSYEGRFGFRFVVFVDGRPRSAIAEAMRERLGRSREEEMAEGLDAIVRIAVARLAP
jgi:2-oxo-4-hydroxy-4-carboxy--5-ureidoimidazoline (OHCU) decarboxylase